MKTRVVIFSLLLLIALLLRMAYAESLSEWLIKPGGSPPVIIHSFASEKLSHNDSWKIYLEANDPDGDMSQIVSIVDRTGHGSRVNYTVIKKNDRARLSGYINCYVWSGIGPERKEWTRLTLTLFIRDKGGNTSNKVVFPLAISQGIKQGPPPPPFDIGGLKRLGAIRIKLFTRPSKLRD